MQHTTVESYLSQFPTSVRTHLDAVRKTITTTVPDATESIAYAMPAYKYKGKPLIYFAGYAKHVGLYATPTGHEAFTAELARYKQGKGSVQFPITEPMPLALIERIVKHRITQIENDIS
jgi:uncharacterized protein YdhG (YjbR/CyaY superfamily)